MKRSAKTKGRSAHSVIATSADLARGVRALVRLCPVMADVSRQTGLPPLRRFEPGFEGLARIVVGQQLSIASAGAIWARTAAAIAPLTPEALLAASDATLRAAGLSTAKVRTLRALATAIATDGLDLALLVEAPEEEVRERLTVVSGIGPWTADIFVLFCLGRADGWAAGDLALQLSLQRVLGLAARPSAAEAHDIAERWRPWRGVAARLLWAHYAIARPLADRTGTAAPKRAAGRKPASKAPL